MQPGLQLAHKPVGVSSFSIVQALQKELAARAGRRWKICHGGTLDPFAEGLLLLLIGQATRLMPLLHPIPKRYVAEVRWGEETDTGDAGGRVVSRGDASSLSAARLDEALAGFLGWTDQVPPATSAKKVGGEPAYKRVFRGEHVVLPPSRVYLHQARWASHALPATSRLELTCRGGFYVRALARDVGRQLGCGAHLLVLSRPAIGPWDDPGPLPAARRLITGPALLPWCPVRVLSDAELGELRQERPIPTGQVRPGSWPLPPGFPDPEAPIRALHRDRLVGLLGVEGRTLHATALFPGGL